jgi:hypothetical protein
LSYHLIIFSGIGYKLHPDFFTILIPFQWPNFSPGSAAFPWTDLQSAPTTKQRSEARAGPFPGKNGDLQYLNGDFTAMKSWFNGDNMED